MKIIQETEKAIKVEVVLEFVNIEKSKTWNIWIPKKCINENGVLGWFSASKESELKAYFNYNSDILINY